ncbi:PREDICTED: RING-H2 finger protein ATL66-like [Tarenaya hassleriana]|uniref:RING-H2 finger protein ATL66-like n=1 Tax=Tarenaya hassleriana TaxID=28532 RepID=UPI00053C3F3D|nr:PREDICTED: RING-H2 finger protein ATL66-like [Tarenaya hassleriana]
MTSSPLPPPHGSTVFYWHETEYDDRNFQIHGRTLFYAVVVFSTALLLVFLSLYIRRICLLRLPHSHAPPQLPLTRFVSDGGGGLDPAVIRSLPVVLCRREAGAAAGAEAATVAEESECCICLGGFEDGDKVKVLPQCRHCYHCECVDRWLRSESSCPICRVSVRVDSSVSIAT